MARGRMRRGPGAPVEKAKDFKGTMKKLLQYLGAYKISHCGSNYICNWKYSI